MNYFTRRIWGLLLGLGGLLLAAPVRAQITPLPPLPSQFPATDSGRVVRGLTVDTARRAAGDTLQAKKPARRAPVSLAGLSSLRTRWVKLDKTGKGRLTDSTSVMPGSVTLADTSGRALTFDPATGAVQVSPFPGRR